MHDVACTLDIAEWGTESTLSAACIVSQGYAPCEALPEETLMQAVAHFGSGIS